MTSPIGEWLEAHLTTLPLSEDCEGYLLGRGASPDTLERLGIREWEPASTPRSQRALHVPLRSAR